MPAEPRRPSKAANPPARRLGVRAVVDSCVFARTKWMKPILGGARAGYLAPIWSPCIIAETTRLLTKLWIKHNAGDVSAASWRKYSKEAKDWFAVMTLAFEVEEDRPPYEAQWVDPPPDEWDVPIWTAALRSGASIIVTENLKDAPPEDDRGMRLYRGVLFMHPDVFIDFLQHYSDLVSTRSLPMLRDEPSLTPLVAEESTPVADTEATDFPPHLRRTIEEVLKKADEKHLGSP